MYMFVHANLLHFVDDIAFVDCWKFVQSKKAKSTTIQYARYLLWLNLLSQLCLLKVKGKEVKVSIFIVCKKVLQIISVSCVVWGGVSGK